MFDLSILNVYLECFGIFGKHDTSSVFVKQICIILLHGAVTILSGHSWVNFFCIHFYKNDVKVESLLLQGEYVDQLIVLTKVDSLKK